MSNDKKRNEVVKIGGNTYVFRFDFSCLKEMDEHKGHNVFNDAMSLSTGASHPTLVSDVIEVSITELNGEAVSISDAPDVAEQFINDAGFQIAHTVVQKLLAYILIGDEKKSVVGSLEKVIDELKHYSVSHLENSINRQWLWMYRIGNFGLLIWLIFSEFGLRSLLKMV